MIWALMLIITVKYLAFVMRADNGGEGGILALTSLITPLTGPWRRRRRVLVLLGLFGTAMLYGDGMITPAISVLAAVEGAAVIAPELQRLVVPTALTIIVGLFTIQRWERLGWAPSSAPSWSCGSPSSASSGSSTSSHNLDSRRDEPRLWRPLFRGERVRGVLVAGSSSW